MPRGPPGATLSPTPVKVLKSLAAAVDNEEDLRSILEMETRILQYQEQLQQQRRRLDGQDADLEAARQHYETYYLEQYQQNVLAQQAQYEAVIAEERRMREEQAEQMRIIQLQVDAAALREEETAKREEEAAKREEEAAKREEEAAKREEEAAASSSGRERQADSVSAADAKGGLCDDEEEEDDEMADLLSCLGQESRKVHVLTKELEKFGVDAEELLAEIDDDFGDDGDEEDDADDQADEVDV